MRIDKDVKGLFKRINYIANNKITYSNNNNNNNRILVGVDKHDDEYYMDILNTTPTRFVLYRHVRMEKWIASGHEPFSSSEYDNSITQDELDYYLKWKLRTTTPEERYQDEKKEWFFHDSSWYHRNKGNGGYDGYGCNNGECIPECKYYPEYGRIEDEEVIADHNEWVEYCRKRNAIVEPPSYSELLELINSERFSWLKNCS